MASEQSMENGAGTRHSFSSVTKGAVQELHDTVLPQAAALLSDAEAVLRHEIRLVEARFFRSMTRLQLRLVTSLMGVGAVLVAFGLFVMTLFYVVRENFPQLPIWSITGGLAVAVLLLGAALLSGESGAAGDET